MECTCNKTKYGSQKEADWDIARIREKSKRSVVPIRSYRCKSGCWHITSKEDLFKNSEIEIRNNKIALLEEEVKKLREENASLKSVDRKEVMLEAKVDQRVKRLNDIISKNGKTLSRLRKDNSELITRIVQLEKQVCKTT